MHQRKFDIGNFAKIAVTDSVGRWSYEFVSSDPFSLRDVAKFNSSVAIRSSSSLVISSALMSLDGWASHVHLLPPDVNPLQLKNVKHISEFTASTSEIYTASVSEVATEWILYSSGTTGNPKPVNHSIESLARTVSRRKNLYELTWGMLYDPNRMAGTQVLLQSLCTGAEIVEPDTNLPLNQRIEFMKEKGVNALSATPTMWRRILQCNESDGWKLKQVTLGGEIADQKILDALIKKFESARIVHIFASTETGAAFAVADGKAGFPRDFLDYSPNGIQLNIRDNILHVENQMVSTDQDNDYISTGDVVEVLNDRVFFRGRQSGQVNIGGSKVWPEEVEVLIRKHPLVLDARVVPKPNPFSGNILTAQVILNSSAHPGIESELRKWVSSLADKQFVPAVISIVDYLEISTSGKVSRK